MEELTEVVYNREPVPQHPADTTARTVKHVLEVRDAIDNTRCTAGLPRAELALLMRGEKVLDHLYRYAILNQILYTTRVSGVRLVVKCVDINEPEPANS